jgi:endonuclease/exonuclease/phosphatase family metal-dependent hydrolase
MVPAIRFSLELIDSKDNGFDRMYGTRHSKGQSMATIVPPCKKGGTATLRYPVLQVLRHALPWPVDAAVMSMQRGLIDTTLSTPLGPMRVAATHRSVRVLSEVAGPDHQPLLIELA